eukprot:362561-Chlamydomonas_euryale.AAC.1
MCAGKQAEGSHSPPLLCPDDSRKAKVSDLTCCPAAHLAPHLAPPHSWPCHTPDCPLVLGTTEPLPDLSVSSMWRPLQHWDPLTEPVPMCPWCGIATQNGDPLTESVPMCPWCGIATQNGDPLTQPHS